VELKETIVANDNILVAGLNEVKPALLAILQQKVIRSELVH
jgi:hypothetical protein